MNISVFNIGHMLFIPQPSKRLNFFFDSPGRYPFGILSLMLSHKYSSSSVQFLGSSSSSAMMLIMLCYPKGVINNNRQARNNANYSKQ